MDIFEALNQLNLKMQGKGKDIIQFVDFAGEFVEKLGNWKCKVKNGNFNMFHSFTCLSDADDEIKDEVADHLGTLQTEFKSYFHEFAMILLHWLGIHFVLLLSKWMTSFKMN